MFEVSMYTHNMRMILLRTTISKYRVVFIANQAQYYHRLTILLFSSSVKYMILKRENILYNFGDK